MSSKNKRLDLDKDILYELYINQQYTSKEVAKFFDCTSKCVRNYLIKYGIPARQNSEAVALERSKWSDEKEAQRSKNYLLTWNCHTEEEKQEINNRRTVNIHTEEAVKRQIAGRIANGTSKVSKAEMELEAKLKLFLAEGDLVHHYIDEQRYPFDCDFYIKSKDLFIEYQGHQTHGPGPYDSTNEEHQDCVKRLNESGFGSNTFEHRDPQKLNTAIQNNINLLLIYPRNNSYLVTNGQVKNIGKFDVTKINELC